MPVTIDGSNTPTAGGVGYGDGTELAFTTAGTAGQILISNGSSTPTWAAVPTVNLATGVTGTLPVANGGTGTTSLTANNVLLGNGTSAVQLVAPGSSGNVLTSNGTTWTSAAAAGGAWNLISTNTISGPAATFDITGVFSSTYDDYCILVDSLTYNASDTFDLRIAYGGSFLTTEYIQQYTNLANVASAQRGAGQDRIYMTNLYNSTAPSWINGRVWVMNRNSSTYSSVTFELYGLDGISSYSGMRTVIGSGSYYPPSAPISGLRFFASTNAMQTGTFRVYGIKKS